MVTRYLTIRDLRLASTYLAFGKARIVESLDDIELTHVVVSPDDLSQLSRVRNHFSRLAAASLYAYCSDVSQTYLASSLPNGCSTAWGKLQDWMRIAMRPRRRGGKFTLRTGGNACL